MRNKLIIILILAAAGRADLVFSSPLTSTCTLIPFFKKKGNLPKEVTEDSCAKLPHAMALGDGVGGTPFNSQHGANAVSTRFLRFFHRKFPQGFQRNNGAPLRNVVAELLNDELRNLDKEFQELIAKHSRTKSSVLKSNFRDYQVATTFISAFIEQQQGATALIHFIQRGDSLGAVFRPTRFTDRNGKTVFLYRPIYKSKEHQMGFNTPYCLAQDEECVPESLTQDSFEILPNDIVVLGSDGLWDNVFVHVLTWFINLHVWSETSGIPMDVAEIVRLVAKHSCPPIEGPVDFGLPGALPEILMKLNSRSEESRISQKTQLQSRRGRIFSDQNHRLVEYLTNEISQISKSISEVAKVSQILVSHRLFPRMPASRRAEDILELLRREPVMLDWRKLNIPGADPSILHSQQVPDGHPDPHLFLRRDSGQRQRAGSLIVQSPSSPQSGIQGLATETDKRAQTKSNPPRVTSPIDSSIRKTSRRPIFGQNPLFGIPVVSESESGASKIQSNPNPNPNHPKAELYGPKMPILEVFAGCTATELFGNPDNEGLSNDLLPKCFLDRLVDGNGLTSSQLHSFWESFDSKKLSDGIAQLALVFSRENNLFTPFALHANRFRFSESIKNPQERREMEKLLRAGKVDDITVAADLVVSIGSLTAESHQRFIDDLEKADDSVTKRLSEELRHFLFE